MSARQEARERRDARAARAATLAAAAHAVSGAAEQAREELEGALWQAITWAIRNAADAGGPVLQGHVRIVLSRADAYAEAVAIARIGAELDDRARQRRLASAEASAAEHRERLEQATS